MKILFVATRKNCDPSDRELYEMDFMNELLGLKRSLFDLGLLTVAACTPDRYQVEVQDEYLAPINYDTDADLVALSAKTSAVARAYQVADEFRRRGRKVVLGGIHASLRPEEALGHVDYVVMGEAETIWPEFLAKFERGEAPQKTVASGFPPMDKIPVPAWDKIDYGEFLFHQIQSTRGCPFTCRFCSVPDISGSTFRFKPTDKIIEEIRGFPKTGFLRDKIKTLYFVDDNFISRPQYTEELLKALIPLRKRGEVPNWSAETTLNVTNRPGLLDMFVEAGCTTLIIGIESINEATLLDMDKKVNFCVEYQEAMHRIHSRGLSVVGNFIVGFDTDTLSVFDDILDFIDENHILYPFFSILTPMPGTKLHDDFNKAGRLDHLDWQYYDTRHVVFEPRNMTREQLLDGYCYLFEQAYATERSLNRLEKYWRTYRKTKSGFVRNLFLKWKLRKYRGAVSPKFDFILDEGWRRLSQPGVNSDVVQLLYYLDSAHFVQYLNKFKSVNYDENIRIFNREGREKAEAAALKKRQWEHKRQAVG
ncbi:MAG: B12-binding domain-containing radical SAM protein [Deltaproteobacteria bacterium]